MGQAIQVVASEDCDARESLELLAERPWRCFVLAGNWRRQRNQSIFLDSQTITMNVSGTLSFFRLFRDPSLCLPHHTVSTFNHLPIPLSRAFTKADGEKKVDIRAVVLDKDNCFAVPKENEVYKPYTVRF